MLNFCDFIQVYVFTTNHHLNADGTSGSFQMSDSKDFEMAPSTVFMCEILTFFNRNRYNWNYEGYISFSSFTFSM